jgi:hypothetical protein
MTSKDFAYLCLLVIGVCENDLQKNTPIKLSFYLRDNTKLVHYQVVLHETRCVEVSQLFFQLCREVSSKKREMVCPKIILDLINLF